MSALHKEKIKRPDANNDNNYILSKVEYYHYPNFDEQIMQNTIACKMYTPQLWWCW